MSITAHVSPGHPSDRWAVMDAAIAQHGPARLQDVVPKTLDLPAMPFIATRVMRAVEEPTSTINVIAALVQSDPGITAWIMRVVNSAAFGRQRKVSSLPQAVSLLGFNELKNLVVSASMRALYRSFGPAEKAMWQHSVAVAVGARLIAMRAAKGAREAAFLAGQMHDVGRLVLRNQLAKQLEEADALAGEFGPVAAEERTFGYSHSDVGALVIQRWGLPSAIEAAAFYHHDLDLCSSLAMEHLPLVSCVSLADALAHRMLGAPAPDDDLQIVAAAAALNLAPDDVEGIGAELVEAVRSELSSA